MAQYMAMRKSLPADIILFYRLGDFYEMFFEDAKTAAPILNVALTKRGGTPMCGVPYHAAQGYIARLLKAGKRVAIAEQTSDPKPGKLVEREIARILSPGSIDDLTCSTTSARTTSPPSSATANPSASPASITPPASSPSPSSRISASSPTKSRASPRPSCSSRTTRPPSSAPHQLHGLRRLRLPARARHQLLKDHFNVHSLDGFGCANLHPPAVPPEPCSIT
jgi:DNA mismatch repair protein MutS